MRFSVQKLPQFLRNFFHSSCTLRVKTTLYINLCRQLNYHYLRNFLLLLHFDYTVRFLAEAMVSRAIVNGLAVTPCMESSTRYAAVKIIINSLLRSI